MKRVRLALVGCVLGLVLTVALVAPPVATADSVGYLDNGVIRVGVDMGKGGTITYISRSGSGLNVVNSWDLGREVQQSYYSGPDNFGNPAPPWANFPWNPIGAGDTYRNPATVLEQSNDGTTIYTKTAPLQWALNHVPCECLVEQWIRLDGNAVSVRNRLTNSRADQTQYHAYGQELPAVYTNGTFWRLFSYVGAAPYTNGPLTQIYSSLPDAKQWQATEHWSALVDDLGFGLGVFNSFATRFGGFFSGTAHIGGPSDEFTGYLGPNIQEILDWNIVYQYDYALVLGTLDQIRGYAYAHRADDRPNYQFVRDRQHFWYFDASDAGWPIVGALHVRLDQSDPQLWGPEQWWEASKIPSLTIKAAYHTSDTQAQLFWSVPDQGFSEERSVRFTARPDGRYHSYKLNLAASPAYKGTITGIRFDPSNGQDAAGVVDIASITWRPAVTPAKKNSPVCKKGQKSTKTKPCLKRRRATDATVTAASRTPNPIANRRAQRRRRAT